MIKYFETNPQNYNFWLDGPILEKFGSKHKPKRQEKFLYFSQILIGPRFDLEFEIHCFILGFLQIAHEPVVQPKFIIIPKMFLASWAYV